MGRHMKNAPVYFMIAQIRFNPILDLGKYLPEIQGQMRASGFPDFKEEVAQQFTLAFGKGESGKVSPPVSSVRYIFGNIDGTAGFVLTNNALAFQTTAYVTFEDFLRMFLDGLGTVHEQLRLDFTERVGLRYLDAVLPNAGEKLSDYLIPEVLGVSHVLEGNVPVHAFSETMFAMDAGHLVSRVLVRNGQVGLPPEIGEIAPKLAPKFTVFTGTHAILDSDAFHGGREAFDTSVIGRRLTELHAEIVKVFKTVATAHAFSVWVGE